jgi:Tol biopolymer transport system component
MKKAIFIVLVITLVISLLLLLNACNLKKGITETKDSGQPAVESSKESAKVQESNNEDIQANTLTEDESEFEKIYNPPEGGNPENIGKIIFCSQSTETEYADYYLYTIDADGSSKTKLPDFGAFMTQPAWSPERSRIAYSVLVDGKAKIFIMTVDGSENKQLTFGDSRDILPTWSPDGKLIAYISYPSMAEDSTPNLFVIDIYGNNQKQLTFVEGEDAIHWPSFSPVEDVIAYSYNKAGPEIGNRLYTIKSDGTQMLELIVPDNPRDHDCEPDWTPDGKVLYFASNRGHWVEIWKVDYYKIIHNLSADEDDKYDDIGLAQISNLHSPHVILDHRPRLSPDGSKIVFYGLGSDWEDIGTNLYTINIDGTGLTNITKSTDGDEWPDW